MIIPAALPGPGKALTALLHEGSFLHERKYLQCQSATMSIYSKHWKIREFRRLMIFLLSNLVKSQDWQRQFKI